MSSTTFTARSKDAAATASSTARKNCLRFSLVEIKLATNNFRAIPIGKGGFGTVYKGVIDNMPVIVAIKRLESNSAQGLLEFRTEIETLTELRHSNVVSLIGYCKEEGEMILAYEYIANQTLDYHLHELSGNNLSWSERLHICIGACQGLHYLHTSGSIIHCDVKSTNILLDENFVAKVSDFGLAKSLRKGNSQSHVTENIKGTRGYLDPRVLQTFELTKATDTYAFGVVLLEVVSGRRALDPSLPSDEQLLSQWAQRKINRGKAREIVASDLRGPKISKRSINTFIELAARCLDHEPKNRPTMVQVLAQLEAALNFQQERGTPTRHSQFSFLSVFQPRVAQSGSTQEDQNQVGVNMLPAEAIPAIQEDVLEYEQNVNMLQIDVPAIPLAVLKATTDDFSERRVIATGSGGGILFRGVLGSGQDVAIKRLKWNSSNKEFLTLVSRISILQHENVARLLGYSVDAGMQILAYEFAAEGSLHNILHGRGLALSWPRRIKIALEAAKGLCYIHDEKALIHHNIKSSNVLLFDDEKAKITDVCLPTEHPCGAAAHNGCHYHAPECGWSGQSQKVDVYSFGVVLLELLTGRKPFVSTKPTNKQLLATWATLKINNDKVHEIVDARLRGDYSHKAVEKMARVAELCLRREADSRPEMSTVLRELEAASWETKTYLRKHQQQARISTPGTSRR